MSRPRASTRLSSTSSPTSWPRRGRRGRACSFRSTSSRRCSASVIASPSSGRPGSSPWRALDDLVGRAVREVAVTFAGEVSGERLANVTGVTLLSQTGADLRLTVAGSMDPLIKALGAHEVVSLTSREPDLEDIFLTYYGEGTGDARVAPSSRGCTTCVAPSPSGRSASRSCPSRWVCSTPASRRRRRRTALHRIDA